MAGEADAALRRRAFALTFLAYACFHMTRKVPSVVKGVLHPQGASGRSSFDAETNPGWEPFNQDLVPEEVAKAGYEVNHAGHGLDGHYSCHHAANETCRRFSRESGHGAFADLVLVPDEVVPGLGCPFPELDSCWALRWRPSGNASTAELRFAQPYDGRLPSVGSASDAPDCIHWERREGRDGSFSVDKKLSVRPNLTDGAVLLGTMDSVFLGFYTVGLFVSGYVGDRVDLRLFLVLGMLGSALCMWLLALAYEWEIHSLAYFILINAVFGLFQSVGWPSVVGVMGSWYGHGNRGLVMGIWNSHTSVGNILGSVITAAAVGTGMHHEDWPLGYALPALIMFLCGLLVWALLVPTPEAAALARAGGNAAADADEGYRLPNAAAEAGASAALLDTHNRQDDVDRVDGAQVARTTAGPGGASTDGSTSEEEGEDEENNESVLALFTRAVRIPGLVPFSLSLMFSKMCAYSVLFWGPYYLGSVGFTSSRAGYLCTFFDVGGILGGIAAGFLSDRIGARGVVAFTFQVLGVPAMALYYDTTSRAGPDTAVNVWMMILVGFFINAPYALITTAVSADLGTQVGGNKRMLALVTGIVDGTGSFGAMIQGIVVGAISSSSWAAVWHFLMLAQAISALMLVRLVIGEVRALRAGPEREATAA